MKPNSSLLIFTIIYITAWVYSPLIYLGWGMAWLNILIVIFIKSWSTLLYLTSLEIRSTQHTSVICAIKMCLTLMTLLLELKHHLLYYNYFNYISIFTVILLHCVLLVTVFILILHPFRLIFFIRLLVFMQM